MTNPGHYDEPCERLLRECQAHGVLLIVIHGNRGHGFSVATVDPNMITDLPGLLRQVADNIEKQTAATTHTE